MRSNSASDYKKIADFSWDRAHKATNAKFRTFWFDQFEVAITFYQMLKTRL